MSTEIQLPKLLFVRHGETDWNRAGRMQGQRDIPLNDRGRRQAARNGRVMAGLIAGGDWSVAVSPLRRTRETLQIMLDGGVAAETPVDEDRLKEVAFGIFEGLTPKEIREQHAELMADRKANHWNFTPPGGESYATLSQRVWNFLESLERPTILVSHGGVMRVILRRLAGMPEAQGVRIFTPQNRVLAITGKTVAFL